MPTSLYIVYYIFAFLLGLCIGSFLNVCIYRIPLGISVAKGRSICPSCETTLKGYDMVPLLSFALLRGKCRSCAAKISPRYPLVEGLTGVLFLLLALVYGFTFAAGIYAVFFACLVCIAFIDMDTQIIPDRFHIVIACLGVAAIFLVPDILWYEHLIGAVCVSLPLLIVALLTGGFGFGDIKLMAAAGLLLGWKLILVGLFVGVIVGALFAVVLLARKKAGRKTKMPFGPFLALGLVTATLVGPTVIQWYTALLS